MYSAITPGDGRMQVRQRQALDLIGIVLRRHLAAAGVGEIRQGVDIRGLRRAQTVVTVAAIGIAGQGRMWLVAHPGLEFDQVIADRDPLDWGVRRSSLTSASR